MSILSQIAEFVDDLRWLGLLAPVFFNLIRVGDVLALGVTMDINRTFEFSLLLACLVSITITLCNCYLPPAPSESANPHWNRSSVSKKPVRDATD